MKRFLISLAVISLCAPAFVQETVMDSPAITLQPNRTILLYGNPKEAEKALRGKDLVLAKKIETLGLEMAEDNGYEVGEAYKGQGLISKISKFARFDLYFPKNPNGQMFIVCPGGGYSYVSSFNEGLYAAEWLLARGITVAVVKYRLPNGHWQVPLTDVQNVFRYCRAHASEWKVEKIGVMGSSAGGHLAASATTMYVDDVTRPDFSVLFYPVISMDPNITHRGTHENLLGKTRIFREKKTPAQHKAAIALDDSLMVRYSLQNNVCETTPPVFLVLCSDDFVVPADNSLAFYSKMIEYGRPVEMHIYPTGGHGWGYNDTTKIAKDAIGYCREEFYTSLSRWIESQK